MAKGWLLNLINKSPKERTKEIIKQWIIRINQTEKLPENIVALNFNLYELPYSIDLIGSASFDEHDEDWACNEDFVPELRICPPLKISNSMNWEDVLKMIKSILKELIDEMPTLELFNNVEHIAVGYHDGDLHIIK